MPVETIEVRTAVPLSVSEKEAWAELLKRCIDARMTPDEIKRLLRNYCGYPI